MDHPDLASENIREIPGGSPGRCARVESPACGHGTFVAGILSGRRGSMAPAICPDCTLLVRPIFPEVTVGGDPLPDATPHELAAAIIDCVDAGANVINLSLALARPSVRRERELEEAIDYAMARGVLVVAAAGNQGTIGSSAITRHPWVIPVVACDLQGRPVGGSNLGSAIGRRGLMAPGDEITGLGAAGEPLTLGGTSVAAPFVAGAIALLWSEYPAATAARVKSAVIRARGPRRTTHRPRPAGCLVGLPNSGEGSPLGPERCDGANRRDQPGDGGSRHPEDGGSPRSEPRPGCRDGRLPAVGGREMWLWLLGRGESRGRQDDRVPRLHLCARAGSSRGSRAWRWRRNSPRPPGEPGTAGLTDRQSLHAVLSERQNRYLARQLCWVLTIEGLETYLLRPRDPSDLDLLVEAVRPAPRPTDVDVVIGVRGPIAPPEMCNGLMVPIVAFDQLYSFDVDALIKAIPRPENIEEEQFGPAAEEVFGRIMQMADNAGATDEHRALNYLAVRYPAIYAKAAEEFGRNCLVDGGRSAALAA